MQPKSITERRAERAVEARKSAEAATYRAIAGEADQANDPNIAYQTPNRLDSLVAGKKALNMVTNNPEYAQISAANWNPEAITTDEVKESNPGLLSKIGTTYTNWTRPFAAPVYYAALKANAAITGDTTNVDEMRRFYDLRKQKAKGDLSRTIGGWFHPLDKEESKILSDIWENNPLPFGILGGIEIFVDPINLLPVTYIGKVTAGMGIGVFKAGTRLVLNKGKVADDAFVALKGGITKTELEGEIVDLASNWTKGAVLDPDNPVTTSTGLRSWLGRKFRGEKPRVSDNNIAGGIAGDSVINSQDEVASLLTRHAQTVSIVDTVVIGHTEKTRKLAGLAFELDSVGGVMNVVLNQTKAQWLISALGKQLDLLPIKTKEHTIIQDSINEIKQLSANALEANPILPHYSSAIEHSGIYNFTTAQTDYMVHHHQMQDEILKMFDHIELDPAGTFGFQKYKYEVVNDMGEIIRGNYSPKIARQRVNAETGDIKEITNYAPFMDRKLYGLIEEGTRSGYNYENSIVNATEVWFGAAGAAASEAILFQNLVKIALKNNPEDVAGAVARMFGELDGQDVAKIRKQLSIEKVGSVQDHLTQGVLKNEEDIESLNNLSNYLDILGAFIQPEITSILARQSIGINSLADITEASLKPAIAQLIKHMEAYTYPLLNKIDEIKSIIGEAPIPKLPPPKVSSRAVSNSPAFDTVPQTIGSPKPRYGQQQIEWGSKHDTLFYTVATVKSKTKSPKHDKIVKYLTEKFGKTRDEIEVIANKVHADVVAAARKSGGLDFRVNKTWNKYMETASRSVSDVVESSILTKPVYWAKLGTAAGIKFHSALDKGIDPRIISQSKQTKLLELITRSTTEGGEVSIANQFDTLMRSIVTDINNIGKQEYAQKLALRQLQDLAQSPNVQKTLEDIMTNLQKQNGTNDLQGFSKKMFNSPDDVASQLTKGDMDSIGKYVKARDAELRTIRSSLKTALENRIEDAKIISPTTMALKNGTIIKYSSKISQAILDSPEVKKLPAGLQAVLDANKMLRFLGTGFDASQPVIQGLRLAFVDPKVWFKIYVGGVKDIVSGNVDAFTWYTQFMSSVSPTDLAKMREMNIAIDELPEYLEILNASSFKGLSEKVNRQLDKVEGGAGWVIDQIKRRPLAAVRAYAAQTTVSRVGMAQALLPQVENAAIKKLGLRSYKALAQMPEQEIIEALRKKIPKQWLTDPATKAVREVSREDALRLIRESIKKEHIDLGEFVNKATGTVNSMADGGISQRIQQHQVAASFLLFAPRFFASQVSLTLDLVRGGTRGQLARESTAKLLGAGFTFYTATAVMLGQEPKLDPRPKKDGGDGGEFLTLKIGGNNVGIGGSATALIKLLTQQYASLRRGTFEITAGLPDPENNGYFKFLSNRLSPIGGVALEVAKGRTYAGQEIDYGDTPISFTKESLELLGPHLAPFWAQGLVDSPMKQGWGSRLSGMGAEFIGFNTYATSPWNVVQELQNQYADSDYGDAYMEMYGRRPLWGDLDDSQQAIIKINHEELRRAEEYARDIWGDKAFTKEQSNINSYMAESSVINDEFNNEYRDMYNKILDRFDSGVEDRPGEYFRDQRANLYRDKTRSRDKLKEQYPEVIEYLNEQRDPDKYIPVFNLIKQQYMDNIVYAEDLEAPNLPGGFDYEKRDRRIVDFIAIYGIDMLNTIRQHVEMVNSSEHFLEREFRWGRDITRKYWNTSDTVIESLGLSNLRALWLRFEIKNSSNSPIDKEEARVMLIVTPELKQIMSVTAKVKVQLRIEDPLMERFLYKYGYLGTFESKENQEMYMEQLDLSGGIGMASLDIPYPEWKLQAILAEELDNEQ